MLLCKNVKKYLFQKILLDIIVDFLMFYFCVKRFNYLYSPIVTNINTALQILQRDKCKYFNYKCQKSEIAIIMISY